MATCARAGGRRDGVGCCDGGERVILGVGTDLIEIERVRRSVERFGDRFLERVFTPFEIAYCRTKVHGAAESFAARFAAKEAGAKALGTGISRGVRWTEIEVRNERGGKPGIVWSGRALERAQAMGVVATQLSLTHSREMAMAIVLVEGRES